MSSDNVIKVMLSARTDSTYTNYHRYWALFVRFCAERDLDPESAGIDPILTCVDDNREAKDWSYSTVKVCVSGISFFRGRLENDTVFRNEHMTEYLAGVKKLSAKTVVRAETWDASLVLRSLEEPPFEPMATADMEYVSAKLAVLLALTTASRGCELTALTIKGLVFSGDLKVTLFPDPSFVPKTVSVLSRRAPVVLHAFHPAPVSRIDKRRHLSCPVRAMRFYLQRTRSVRKSDSLLLTHGGRNPGTALTTQRLAHWLVDGITKAYTLQGQTAPKLRAHSTRGTATSIAVLAGIDWEVIRQAAVWQGDQTFLKHYYRYTKVRSVADAVLEQAHDVDA